MDWFNHITQKQCSIYHNISSYEIIELQGKMGFKYFSRIKKKIDLKLWLYDGIVVYNNNNNNNNNNDDNGN